MSYRTETLATLKLIDGRLDIEAAESKDGIYFCASYHEALKRIIERLELQETFSNSGGGF